VLSLLLYALIAIVVAVGLFLVVAHLLPAGEQIAPPLRDEPPWELPAGRALGPADVDAVRLPVSLRGYRFAETDLLLDRLASELRDRDDEIARLRRRLGETPPNRAGQPEAQTEDQTTVPAADEQYAPPPSDERRAR
jgi:hypothetical protein